MFGWVQFKLSKGPRKQQKNVYLNLSRINSAPKQHQDCISLSDVLAGISIPSDWKMVTDKTDFISLEEFNNVRAVTEVVVSKPYHNFHSAE